ncbi:MAG: acetyl-CoA carboxylase carboxyltransferase subunit alpha [Planctomycetota bacterium]
MTTLNAYRGLFELDFEKPILQLEKQIADMEAQNDPDRSATGLDPSIDYSAELRKLRASHTAMLRKTYQKLSAHNTVKVARHPGRPQTIDYIEGIVKDFCELHGDRRHGDDRAILAGFGRIGPHKCLVLGHHKGKDTKDKIAANFGMPHPEGYRKALRCMKLAEKFGLPVVSFIDTPGAYPGVEAEERGQGQAIAENLLEMARLKTPIVCVVLSEGGSGGALGIGVGDRLAMLQYAWWSVISPEGCAAILWKQANAENNAAAAEAMRVTAASNKKLGTIDAVIDEPLGAAHRDPQAAMLSVERYVTQAIRELKRFKVDNLIARRQERLAAIGELAESV